MMQERAYEMIVIEEYHDNILIVNSQAESLGDKSITDHE